MNSNSNQCTSKVGSDSSQQIDLSVQIIIIWRPVFSSRFLVLSLKPQTLIFWFLTPYVFALRSGKSVLAAIYPPTANCRDEMLPSSSRQNTSKTKTILDPRKCQSFMISPDKQTLIEQKKSGNRGGNRRTRLSYWWRRMEHKRWSPDLTIKTIQLCLRKQKTRKQKRLWIRIQTSTHQKWGQTLHSK